MSMDPITREVISSSLLAYADEMTNNFWRTSYSYMNYEMRDYAVGLVDGAGRIVTQSRFTHPAFTADLGFVVQAALEELGDEGVEEGDVIVSNDPVSQGQHLNNVVVFTPYMLDGKPFMFSCVRAHWQDVGGGAIGSGATNSTEIFQEGIQLNAVKVHRAGTPDKSLLRVIKYNSRFPDLVLGDLNAQIAACKIGLRRIGELLAKYSAAEIEQAVHETWDMCDRAARNAIKDIPPGEYMAESFLDDDGVERGKPIPIKVKVRVTPEHMTIDFSDISDQVKGSLNSGYFGGAMNVARIAFKCLTTPHLPSNEGCFRALDVICPAGKILHALPPAALGDWAVPFPTVLDTIFRSLADAIPKRIPAATRGDARGIVVVGLDSVKRKFYALHFPHIGGHGGRPDCDAPAPRCAIQQGHMYSVPVEVNESKSPVIFEKYELRPDSGGPGKFRGGLGTETIGYLMVDGQVQNKMIRSKCLPWGLHGGGTGAGNEARVIKPDGTEVILPRTDKFGLPPGHRVRMLTGGGGGYGSPYEREPARVRADYLDGYVTLEGARRDYGVVLDKATGAIDEQETARLRSGLAGKEAKIA
jgi:N-methylhydantoinase B